MSLAPASSRGFFLNARFAVNGIQCAARSFGTATGVGRGLLSGMGGLFSVLNVGLAPKYQLRRETGTPTGRDISAQYAIAFRAKHALGLDPGVAPGSREENASKQKMEPRPGAQRSAAAIQNTSPSESSVS